MSDYLWTAFIARNSSLSVIACTSAEGVTWPPNLWIGQSSAYTPALALFKGRLYAALTANNSDRNLLVCSTSDGRHWAALNGQAANQGTDIHQSAGSGPALAVFQDRLWVGFAANNSGNNILVCSSADGANFSQNLDIEQASNASAPSLAVFDGRLYAAFIANDSGNNVLVCSTANGTDWLPMNGAAGITNPDIGQASNGSSPALAVFAGKLYVAFVANNGGNNILVCSSASGSDWSANTDIGQASYGFAPALTAFNNTLWVAFVSNNDSQEVLLASSSNGQNWNLSSGHPGPLVDIQQSSVCGPALAVAPFSFWPVANNGLGSNNNYMFYRHDHQPLLGVSVTITVNDDMVWNTASGEYTGFSFQLNGYSLNNPNCAWQQYVFDYVNDELTIIINNWSLALDDIYNVKQGVLALPGGRIPANTVMTIALLNDARTLAVVGATFTVAWGGDQSLTQAMTINLPSTDLAPVVAFQVNITGTFNGESSVLVQGGGEIAYSCSEGMALQTGAPSWLEFRGGTAETANTFYAALPNVSSKTFNQAFLVGQVPG